MVDASGDIPDDRDLTLAERDLVAWLLEHGGHPDADLLAAELARARVVARCRCGCASVDFAVDGARPSASAAMTIVADFQWRTAAGHEFGIFAFAREGRLAGLEVWSIDGAATPTELPTADELRPFPEANRAV